MLPGLGWPFLVVRSCLWVVVVLELVLVHMHACVRVLVRVLTRVLVRVLVFVLVLVRVLVLGHVRVLLLLLVVVLVLARVARFAVFLSTLIRLLLVCLPCLLAAPSCFFLPNGPSCLASCFSSFSFSCARLDFHLPLRPSPSLDSQFFQHILTIIWARPSPDLFPCLSNVS